MSKKTPALAAVALLLLLVALLLRSRSSRSGTHESDADAGATSGPEAPTAPSTPAGTAEARGHGVAGRAAPDARALERDRAAREKLRDAIWRAFAQPAPPDESTRVDEPYVLPTSVPDPPGVPGRIEPSYIQDRMRQDFFPMARDCYAEAIARDPDAKGEVVLRFAIVGDANIGGVVESADVLDKSTLRDAELIKCMRESMLTMTFPPPKQGGFVTVEYPIAFSNDDGG